MVIRTCKKISPSQKNKEELHINASTRMCSVIIRTSLEDHFKLEIKNVLVIEPRSKGSQSYMVCEALNSCWIIYKKKIDHLLCHCRTLQWDSKILYGSQIRLSLKSHWMFKLLEKFPSQEEFIIGWYPTEHMIKFYFVTPCRVLIKQVTMPSPSSYATLVHDCILLSCWIHGLGRIFKKIKIKIK